jgi:ribose-phosphate pyrophosphokinase
VKPLFLTFPGTLASLGARLARACGGETASLNARRFPDGESYFRIEAEAAGRAVVLVCSLDRPDPKTTLLQLVAAELRARGATSIGLAAPYLAYMRQDAVFHTGEPVSAKLYAGLISRTVDWLVTVDPHLHRITDLGQAYAIPARTTHATTAMAAWLRANVPDPVLIGPDEESEQWTAAVAAAARAPFAVLRKLRLGDRQVRIEIPQNFTVDAGRTPVLLDDVVSSGKTLLVAAEALRARGLAPSLCLATHGLAPPSVLCMLKEAGLRLVTSDSTTASTTGFSLSQTLAPAVLEMLAGG